MDPIQYVSQVFRERGYTQCSSHIFPSDLDPSDIASLEMTMVQCGIGTISSTSYQSDTLFETRANRIVLRGGPFEKKTNPPIQGDELELQYDNSSTRTPQNKPTALEPCSRSTSSEERVVALLYSSRLNSVSLNILRLLWDHLIKSDFDRVILLSYPKLTSPGLQFINRTRSCIFELIRLPAIQVTQHVLVPKHVRLNEEQMAKILLKMDNGLNRVYKSQQFIISHLLGILDNLEVSDVVQKLMNSSNSMVLRAHWSQVLSFGSFLTPIREQLQILLQELAHLAILAKGYTLQTFGKAAPSIKDVLRIVKAHFENGEQVSDELWLQLKFAYATDWSRYNNESAPLGFKYNLNWFEEECMALRIIMDPSRPSIPDVLDSIGEEAYDVKIQDTRMEKSWIAQESIVKHLQGLFENVDVPTVIRQLMLSCNQDLLRSHWNQVLCFGPCLAYGSIFREHIQDFLSELQYFPLEARTYALQTFGQSPSVKETLLLFNFKIENGDKIPIELYHQLQIAYATDWRRYYNESAPVGLKYNLNWFEEECMALRLIMDLSRPALPSLEK